MHDVQEPATGTWHARVTQLREPSHTNVHHRCGSCASRTLIPAIPLTCPEKEVINSIMANDMATPWPEQLAVHELVSTPLATTHCLATASAGAPAQASGRHDVTPLHICPAQPQLKR
jgi:hypothetical protein